MDRKGKQKVRYILLASAAVVVVAVFFLYGIGYRNGIREKQLRELAVIYPEIESELQDNFTYYQNQIVCSKLIAMAVMVFLVISFSFFIVLTEEREKRKVVSEYDREMDLIFEQLLGFLKGDFVILPSFRESDAAGKSENVREKLHELGCYYSDLKKRLLEEENKTKSLITDISHQLKTPLASIRMCHDLAGSADISEEERNEFLAREAKEIDRMEALLDELVKLSHLESNMIRIKPEKNSLKQTISEAVGRVFMKAHARDIGICVDIEEDAEIFHDRKWTAEPLQTSWKTR